MLGTRRGEMLGGVGDASSWSVIDAVAQYSGAVAAQFFDRSQSTTEAKVI